MAALKFNIPTVIVVFGATGDLMARKITPALFSLHLKKKLPPMFKVIGVSRRGMTHDSFREHVMRMVKKPAGDAHCSEESMRSFCRMFFYQRGEFANSDHYKGLAAEMGRIDGEWHVCSNKLFYLAVPPEYYTEIFTHLHSSGLTDPCSPDEGWTRLLVEKPFGRDLQTARELESQLSSLFKEEQIYRIDHYLGKEMLQNILAFRFGNNFLEESWTNNHIERIDIRVLETLGIEQRGAFYDGLGALKDVGQNHVLQMLALVTMDNPISLTASAIRTKRAELLQSLVIPSDEDIRQSTMRGQYEGYRDIQGVSKDSDVETFFKVRACLSNSRWDGVPIFLSSGKRFPEAKKDITITFRNPQQCLTCAPGKDYNNQIVFSLEPDEKIAITFFSKKPGLTLDIQKKDFTFTYRTATQRTQYVEEYEKLLLDCILGDQTLFVSTPEVGPMWQWTDAIVDGWKKNLSPLKTYMPGTDAIAAEELPGKLHHATSRRMFKKEIGIVGLGKMGEGIALQLIDRGWRVYGYNRTRSVTEALERQGMHGMFSLNEFTNSLRSPRIIWLMVPAGEVVDIMLNKISSVLEKGDIVIDAGNSFYKDAKKRADMLSKKGIRFVDVGISGGPKGARFGACLMVGGDKETFTFLEELFFDMSVPHGYQWFDGIGAGHFVKMVHNGIEYGMMQAIAEGFSLMKKAPFTLDLTRVADIYNHGSVIESRLVGWLKDAFDRYGVNLEHVSGAVDHLGEGKWTVDTAMEFGIDTKIIEGSLQFRINSASNPSFTGKIVSALRGQFGGHTVEKHDTL